MKTPKKGTPMEYTRNYTDDPPPYPLYPGATSTPLTVLLESAEICHTGYERPTDLNILTNMVKGLIQRLDKLDMDKTDEQSVNTPAPLHYMHLKISI